MGLQTEKAPDVSVIICHHVGRLIDRCVESVLTTQGVTYEILVITSDDTYATQDAEVYFLEDGPAAKRNLGARYAKGLLLAFLDDDLEISPYCLYEFKQWMEEHPQCGMAFGKIYKMAEGRRRELDDCGSWFTWTGFLWARAGNYQSEQCQYSVPTRILASKSATCAMLRTTFISVGRFDSAYYILGEETDLAWRVWLQGLEVWYIPTAHSWHAFGCDDLKPKEEFYHPSRVYLTGPRNYISMLFTNLGTLRLCLILPIHVCLWMIVVIMYSFTGRCNYAILMLRGIYENICNIRRLYEKRSCVQRTRQVGDRELFRHIYISPPLSYYFHRFIRYRTTGLHG